LPIARLAHRPACPSPACNEFDNGEGFASL
jgi:hypothetical protein